MVAIREASTHDRDAVWEIFRTVVAAGDTYVFDPEIPREEALAYWFHPIARGVLSPKVRAGWSGPIF